MLSKQLFLAATAAALLLVPEVSEGDNEIVTTLPFPLANGAQSVPFSEEYLELPCQQCGTENSHLELLFSVESGKRLLLNGFELYPSADPWHDDLTANVGAEGDTSAQMLGYGLFVKPELRDAEQAMSIVPIDLQILEIGGQFVTGLPRVSIKLLKLPTGDLIIGNVETENIIGSDADGSHDNPLMRIKEKVEEFWKKLRGGCSRNRHGSHQKHPDIEDLRTYHEEMRHDYPHAHRHGHRRHRLIRLLRNIISNIVLPILAGITAGVGVAVYVFSSPFIQPLLKIYLRC